MKWQQEESASSTTSSFLLTHILPISSVWLRCLLSAHRGGFQSRQAQPVHTHTTQNLQHRQTHFLSCFFSLSAALRSASGRKKKTKLLGLEALCKGASACVWFSGASHWFPAERSDRLSGISRQVRNSWSDVINMRDETDSGTCVLSSLCQRRFYKLYVQLFCVSPATSPSGALQLTVSVARCRSARVLWCITI